MIRAVKMMAIPTQPIVLDAFVLAVLAAYFVINVLRRRTLHFVLVALLMPQHHGKLSTAL